MRILGIDFGEKRIGVALSDPLGFTAQGLSTIIRGSEEQVLQKFLDLCNEHEVSEVVIGLPINMNGTLGPKAAEVLAWVSKMEAFLKRPVKTWDERLTSVQVNRLMIEEGLSRKKQKANKDELSAIVILQSYLDANRMRKGGKP